MKQWLMTFDSSWKFVALFAAQEYRQSSNMYSLFDYTIELFKDITSIEDFFCLAPLDLRPITQPSVRLSACYKLIKNKGWFALSHTFPLSIFFNFFATSENSFEFKHIFRKRLDTSSLDRMLYGLTSEEINQELDRNLNEHFWNSENVLGLAFLKGTYFCKRAFRFWSLLISVAAIGNLQ